MLRYLTFVILKLSTIPVVALGVAMSIYIRTSPYPPTEALMHLVARAGCPAVASVGLAQTREGALGYHARNDPDGDGIACGSGASAQASASDAPMAASRRTVGGAKFIRPEASGG